MGGRMRITMERKYELTDETIICDGRILHRIKAVGKFVNARGGYIGGFIEREENLSHEGDCWVGGNAKAYGDSKVEGDALMCDYSVAKDHAVIGDNSLIEDYAVIGDNSLIFKNAHVVGNSVVGGNSVVEGNVFVGGGTRIGGNTLLLGEAEITGDAVVMSNEDYIVFQAWWSSGRYFTWTRSNNKWRVGCFHGTGEELVAKAYEDSEESGKHYAEIVDYVNRCVLGQGQIQ